jgi:hypothetical protein
MDVLSAFDAPRFCIEDHVCWKVQWPHAVSIFPSVKSIFGYEDYMEHWWNRTERKIKYTSLVHPPQMLYRLAKSEEMTK